MDSHLLHQLMGRSLAQERERDLQADLRRRAAAEAREAKPRVRPSPRRRPIGTAPVGLYA